METMKKEFGKHYIIELFGCNPETINTVTHVEQIMIKAATESNSTILNHVFHQFEPTGVSGFIFIAESHFALHTWPEDNYVGADIFTCGKEMNPDTAIEVMKRDFEATDVRVKVLSRGFEIRTT